MKLRESKKRSDELDQETGLANNAFAFDDTSVRIVDVAVFDSHIG